jgi:hypothetical protein
MKRVVSWLSDPMLHVAVVGAVIALLGMMGD